MIGVIADESEHPVIREFFELFKTPWEFATSDQPYDVLLISGEPVLTHLKSFRVLLVYSGCKLSIDPSDTFSLPAQAGTGRIVSHGHSRIPLYGESVVFPRQQSNFLVDAESLYPAGYLKRSEGSLFVRLGYDLFSEIQFLLIDGQPVSHAAAPSLEFHIAILRELLLAGGVRLMEIPPVPNGYRFIACLTHDVDHPRLRQHWIDHTTVGFAYRATYGSLLNLFRGRVKWRAVLRNCIAAAKLPFVQLHLAKDFWGDFIHRYPTLERGHRSTFFFIPFKGKAGQTALGAAPKRRASRYGALDVEEDIQAMQGTGCEIGLHGIDAWLDTSEAENELKTIRHVTGNQQIGVRMHWLYFGAQSAAKLDQAGADYDSSLGYNGTIGYRNGTTQAYKPLTATRLLELPLHVMDTALFFPSHLNLSPNEARARVALLIDNAVRFGGCITVNWHDRSIAPERCWDAFYEELIRELENRGAWFATAGEVVAWFRKRREASFEDADPQDLAPNDISVFPSDTNLPKLQYVVHGLGESERAMSANVGCGTL